MKPVRYFTCHDTYGRYIELCQAENGNWFYRTYIRGRKTRWDRYDTESIADSWVTETENKYTGEIIKHDPVLYWGWNRMDEHKELPNYRLPKS